MSMGVFALLSKIIRGLIVSRPPPPHGHFNRRILILGEGGPEIGPVLNICLKEAGTHIALSALDMEKAVRFWHKAVDRDTHDYLSLELQGTALFGQPPLEKSVSDTNVAPRFAAVEIVTVSAFDLRLWSSYFDCVILVIPGVGRVTKDSIETRRWMRSRVAQLTGRPAPGVGASAMPEVSWWRRIIGWRPSAPGHRAIKEFILLPNAERREYTSIDGVPVGEVNDLDKFVTRIMTQDGV